MFKNKKIFALIIARKNSKRLKNKNLLKLKKKQLIYWSINSAIKSKYIDKICVSTDIKKIYTLKSNKKIFFDKRPKVLAQSQSTAYDVINYIKNKYLKNFKFEFLVLLQSTSPFRTSKNIDEAIEKFLKSKNYTSLVSVNKLNPKYNHIIVGKENISFPLKKRNNIYIPNGAIFISKIKESIKNFYSKKTMIYEMPFVNSIDIDNIEDYILAKNFEKKLN